MQEARTGVAEPGALDEVRREASRQLNPQRKAELGQFMTRESVAKFMAGLFTDRVGSIRLLDAGAGIGSLTAAFLNRWGSHDVCATVYEIDEGLASYLRSTLGAYANGSFEATIIERDFIQDAVYKITMGWKGIGYTHAILNPPYKNINSDSAHRALLRAVRLETVNLYSAFVGLAIALMAEGGEIVRSFHGASVTGFTTGHFGSGCWPRLQSSTSICSTAGRVHLMMTRSFRRTSLSSSCARNNRARSLSLPPATQASPTCSPTNTRFRRSFALEKSSSSSMCR
ncbi:MAG TPA: hypothetical protein VNY05_00350 [Candidatus Acidoferrales bacterium]|nr:hypothetical protein [Candidatus Acidoferrales bacterium]